MQPTLGIEALAAAEQEEITPEMEEAAMRAFGAKCLSAIKEREKEFETGWWKKADAAFDIYSNDSKRKVEDEVPYNILYSNTEVLLPSLYSATPKPDIRPRFKGQNIKPIPELVQRFLIVASDPASPGGDSFNSAMLDAVLSSLVPGLGYVRLRYTEDRAFPISYESGHYKTLIWGKASRWAKVPWVAFKHPMKKDAMFAQFKIPEEDQGDYTPSSEAEDERDDCCVYEFWDKRTRKVLFLCEEWNNKLVQEAEDPLGLENFYPTPGPLLMTMKPGRLQPVPLYNYYRNQAEELNRVTVRLNKVLSAIRVRGAYNGLLGDDMQKLLGSDDLENELVPAAEAGFLAQSGGFDKHIWMLPIEKLIVVAQELYKAREAIKQVIYELTGISDIIRGSSVASETATAQDLKNKWGTVRLRKMQTTVADYARDLFRMTVDCASERVPAEKWQQVTQMQIPTAEEKAAVQQQMQYLQQVAQTGAPVPPPDPKMLETLQQPSLNELLAKIAADQNRTFVVNIQTSSTIDLDTAQDKTEVQEFMNAMGQLLAGLQPLAALGPSGLEAGKAILIAVTQRYKFGLDIGDIIEKIQAPPPPPPENTGPSEEEKAALAAEAQVKIQEAELKMQEIQMKGELLRAQQSLELAKIEAEKAKLTTDIQLANLRLEQQRTKLSAKPGVSNANV